MWFLWLVSNGKEYVGDFDLEFVLKSDKVIDGETDVGGRGGAGGEKFGGGGINI